MTRSAQIGRICNGTARTFIALSGTMLVWLHRDSSSTGLGFFAYYETEFPPGTLGPELTATIRTTSSSAPISTSETPSPSTAIEETTETPSISTAADTTYTEETSTPIRTTEGYTEVSTAHTENRCGGLVTYSYGSISGPFYPGNNISVQCVWEIEVNPFDYIVLHITYISLDCNKEYIEVFDGSPGSQFLLGRMCSNIYNGYNFTSTSNTLTILMHRDSDYAGYGFDAYYSSVHDATTSAPLHNETSVPPTKSKTLSCSGEYMVARISRVYLQSLGYNEWSLSLNSSDPVCTPQLLRAYVIFNIPYSGCGTVRQQRNNDTIVYSNIINSIASSGIITRKKNFQFHVICEMNENTVVEVSFLTQEAVDIVERQRGHYNVTLQFYHSSSFNHKVYNSPYFVGLNQDLFLQASLYSSDPNLILFIETCVASPDPNDFRSITHVLINNGCIEDSTCKSMPSTKKNEARLKFNSFKFINEHNEVYLQCKLVVCRANDFSSRCYKGCLTRTKRDVGEPQEIVDVIVGPIKLQREDNENRKHDLTKSVNPGKDEAISPLAVATVLLAGMVFVLSGFLLNIKLRRNNYHQIY